MQSKDNPWISLGFTASILQLNLEISFIENEIINYHLWQLPLKSQNELLNSSVRYSHFYTKNVLDHLVCHESNSYRRDNLKRMEFAIKMFLGLPYYYYNMMTRKLSKWIN